MYYKSHNYGGILQAYALQKVINNLGFESEQICYKREDLFSPVIKCKRFCKKLLNYIKHIKIFISTNFYFKNQKRNKLFKIFEVNNINHSNRIYTDKKLKYANNIYSIFITGSDQVWADNISGFFLDFVSNDKLKISYAASISKEELSLDQKKHFKEALSTYNAISVREYKAVELLSEFSGDKKIDLVLDPVLLLRTDEWDKISSTRLIEKEYIFCYYLGNDRNIRNIATKYAERNNLIICTIPHIHEKIEPNDINFGNVQLMDVGPADFISLIKYATLILTDSFHCSAFSCLYKKNFFVFNRNEAEHMNSRITTLIDLFGCNNRFCDKYDEFQLEHMEKHRNSQYDDSKFIEIKDHSFNFLHNVLSCDKDIRQGK